MCPGLKQADHRPDGTCLRKVREKYMAYMDAYLSKLLKPAEFTEMVARVFGGISRSSVYVRQEASMTHNTDRTHLMVNKPQHRSCVHGGRPHRRRSADQETSMKSNTRQRHGYRQLGLWVVLLAASALLLGGPGVEAQGRQFRVAVLTAGLIVDPALEGLREGLAQLGYHEGKDIAFMVEDAQGEVASLASRAAKIVEAKPDVIVHYRHRADGRGQAGHHDDCPSSSPLLPIRCGRAWSPATPRRRTI